jgi:hypothetical protein
VFSYFLLGFLLLSMATPWQFVKATNSLDDWQSTAHAKRLKITIDSDRSTAGINDVNNAVLLFRLCDNNASGNITDGGDEYDDFLIYAYSASGSGFSSTPVTCSYDGFSSDWNATTGGWLAVEIPHLDGDADTTIYLYYDGNGDWDDPSGTYNDSAGI